MLDVERVSSYLSLRISCARSYLIRNAANGHADNLSAVFNKPLIFFHHKHTAPVP